MTRNVPTDVTAQNLQNYEFWLTRTFWYTDRVLYHKIINAALLKSSVCVM